MGAREEGGRCTMYEVTSFYDSLGEYFTVREGGAGLNCVVTLRIRFTVQ